MKIRCIKAYYGYFAVGKFYEIRNDKVYDDKGHCYDFSNIDNFNSRMSSKFELVKEEEKMFKVGDKVKVIKLMKDTERNTNLKIGDIGIVAEDNSKRPWITFKRGVRTDFDRGSNRWPLYEEEIQLINDKFTLSDIKERWLVVFRDGREGIAKKNSYGRIGFNVIKNGEVLCEYYNAYYNDLTHEINDKRDIVKVLKPKYEEVWERPIEKQVKKMTVSEIASVLGYEVEIVKESK